MTMVLQASGQHGGRRRNGDAAGRQTHQRLDSTSNSNNRRNENSHLSKMYWKRLYWFSGLLVVDGLISSLVLLPLFRPIEHWEHVQGLFHFSMSSSLWDVAFLGALRIATTAVCMALSYFKPMVANTSGDDDSNLYHVNGTRKTQDELELEEIEESCTVKQLKKMIQRYAFYVELLIVATGIWISVKCMARLNVEIGIYDEARPPHPLFWLALAITGILSLLEGIYIDSMEQALSKLQQQQQQAEEGFPRSNSQQHSLDSLSEPLLSNNGSVGNITGNRENTTTDVQELPPGRNKPDNIQEETPYKATWADIIEFVLPDTHWVLLATVFLLLAAVCNVFVPHYTGKILDVLTQKPPHNQTSFEGMEDHSVIINMLGLWDADENNDNGPSHRGILKIPGFLANIEMLVLVSILGGVFAGVRGAIFSTVGARCNARLRIQLMDSLLCQDIGFYDTTRTGEVTSRLSSDTTMVGAAVTNNVNVFLRSVVKAAGTLLFMCFISWQLTILAFLTVPAVSVCSRWYGRYLRKLSKAQQKKLADGNNVSETVISSMATVRAFGAERLEMKEFQACMHSFLQLNLRSALATFGFQTFVGSLPQLVEALVLFYGGLLVQSDRSSMTGGQLITFVLYLSTLADAFFSLGGIYASLSRAVGAAEKVFAMMHRKPKRTIPKLEGASTCSTEDDIERQQSRSVEEEENSETSTGSNNLQSRSLYQIVMEARQKRQSRVDAMYTRGLYPSETTTAEGGFRGGGEITFCDVEARYPARPQRVVLDGLNLTIPAGSVCALVGSSGSGKSSIVKLIQNLYEPTKGKVCIDGIDVRQLSPEWLATHVAVVSQEPTLFARSVRQNIVYGLEDGPTSAGSGSRCATTANVPEEEIKEAARLANASGFIEKLPQGYDTEVGERGIQLSGGQKQRCALARAFVRKPCILLLDEATAALDSESEYVVQQAIDNMISEQRAELSNGTQTRSPMTVLMIAHRLSTVRNADIIFVVEDGMVVEQGNHRELIEKEDGVYKALVSRQISSE